MEKDPVLEKYENEGFGKNVCGWYFNPWLDEYDEDYDPHNDPEYNKDLVNKEKKGEEQEEIKWHPKLTKEQIEELIAENIYPGDNEYDMYLWNHGINPTEKYEEKEIEEEVVEPTPELKEEPIEKAEEKVIIDIKEEPIKDVDCVIGVDIEEPSTDIEVPEIVTIEPEEKKEEPLGVKPRKKIPVMEDIDSGREGNRVKVNPEDLEDEFEVVNAPLEIQEKGIFGKAWDKIKETFKKIKERRNHKKNNKRKVKKPSLIKKIFKRNKDKKPSLLRRVINKIKEKRANNKEEKEEVAMTDRAKLVRNIKVEEDKTPVIDSYEYRVAYDKEQKDISELNKDDGMEI